MCTIDIFAFLRGFIQRTENIVSRHSGTHPERGHRINNARTRYGFCITKKGKSLKQKRKRLFMSVYDNNRSNFSGGRGCDRRFGGGRSPLPFGALNFGLENKMTDSQAASATPCNPDNNSGCDFEGLGGGAPSLAMVYCPRQYWRGILSPDEALKRGTLFAELHKPFAGDGMK